MNWPAPLDDSARGGSGGAVCAYAGATLTMSAAATSDVVSRTARMRSLRVVQGDDQCLGPGDVYLVADFHFGERRLVLDARAVLPAIGPGERDRRRLL